MNVALNAKLFPLNTRELLVGRLLIRPYERRFLVALRTVHVFGAAVFGLWWRSSKIETSRTLKGLSWCHEAGGTPSRSPGTGLVR